MAACAHNAGYDKCPPMNIAKEFNEADKGTGILGHNKKSVREKAFPLKGGKLK